MSRAVADATVLIYLARLGDLHMLDEFFESIVGSASLSEFRFVTCCSAVFHRQKR